MGKNSKKNAGVELARIIACLIVIGCHVYPEAIFDKSRTLIAMFFADGVSVFWFICGFYLFNNTDQKKLVKHTVKRLVIPSVILLFTTFFLSGFIAGKVSLLENICHSKEDYINLFKNIITWTPYGGCDHLWYVLIYILVVLLYPLIRPAVSFIDSDIKYQNRFLIISAALVFCNDLLKNQLLDFSHHTIGGLIPALIQIIWGHIIYTRIKDLDKLRYALIAAVTFVAANIVRFLIGWNEFAEVINWYNLGGIISACCILVFSFVIMNNVKSDKVRNVICYLGSLTFYIYLVHMLAIGFLSRIGVTPYVDSKTIGCNDSVLGEIEYTLARLVASAIISAVIAILIERIMYIFKKNQNKGDK